MNNRAKRLLWFLRPTLFVLVCFFAAMTLSYALSEQRVESLDDQIKRVTDFANELGPIQKPSPDLRPEQVAEIQATSLGNPDQNRGAVQCMCFASPDNLIVTGPLEKFARMVRGPKFAALSNPQALLVGKPIFHENNARVLVTAVSSDDSVSAYVWVLAKQSKSPYEDCWMTDGVFPMTQSDEWGENEI